MLTGEVKKELIGVLQVQIYFGGIASTVVIPINTVLKILLLTLIIACECVLSLGNGEGAPG